MPESVLQIVSKGLQTKPLLQGCECVRAAYNDIRRSSIVVIQAPMVHPYKPAGIPLTLS